MRRRQAGTIAGRAVRAVTSAVGLLAVLGGAPVVLAAGFGWPLPAHLPASWDEWQVWLTNPPADPDTLIADTLACLGWLAWAQFALAVAAETYTALTHTTRPRVRLAAAPIQSAAALLVSGLVLGLLTRPTARAGPAPATAAAVITSNGPVLPHRHGDDAATTTVNSPALHAGIAPAAWYLSPPPPVGMQPGPGIDTVSTPATNSVREYQVQREDTLWSIAEQQLGDPLRYPEIAALNHGRPQPDGHALTDDHWIRPGWTLLLPTHTPPAEPRQMIVVQEGDTLWDLAEEHLGSGEDYETIFHANQGRPQPDGQTLIDPAHIQPGWHLLLPAPPQRPVPDPTTPADPTARPPRQPHPPTPPGEPSSPQAPTPTAPSPSATQFTSTPTPPPTSPHGPGQHDQRPATPGFGVPLPNGGVVGLGLAGAVATLVALARLRRRARRRPDDPLDQTEPVLSPAVATLQEAWLAASRNATTDDDQDDEDDEWAPGGGVADPAPSGVRLDVLPRRLALPPPGHAAVSVDHPSGNELLLDLIAARGLGVTGPGMAGVVRALLVSVLSSGGVLHTRLAAERGAVEELFGEHATALAAINGVDVRTGIDAVLLAGDAEMAERDRLIGEVGAPDLAAYRGRDDADTVPAAILVLRTPTDPDHTRRLAALLDRGPARDLTAILLGGWPDGTACHIDAGGTITTANAEPGSPLAVGRRLFTATVTEAAEVLGLLTETRGGLDFVDHLADDVAACLPALPAIPTPPAGIPTPPGEQVEVNVTAGQSGDADLPRWITGVEQPIVVCVFGGLRIFTTRPTVEVTDRFRQKIRDLLAYLVTHPNGSSKDTIVEAIWPGASQRSGQNRFTSTLTHARNALRDILDIDQRADLIPLAAGRYRLDHAVIATDYQRFAIALADTAANGGGQIAALARAADTYTGELLHGLPYSWATAVRELARNQTVDTLAALASATEADDPALALSALDRAIAIDPYCQAHYRHAMRLHAELGHHDTVQRLLRLLEERLADIDDDPSEDTLRLAAYLHRQASQPRPRQRRDQNR